MKGRRDVVDGTAEVDYTDELDYTDEEEVVEDSWGWMLTDGEEESAGF